MSYQKIKDYSDLVRDTHSNAIINVNSDLYYAAKMRKIKAKKDSNEIITLRKEMAEIKSLLKTLINNNIQQ
jgi:hypothetical protein